MICAFFYCRLCSAASNSNIVAVAILPAYRNLLYEQHIIFDPTERMLGVSDILAVIFRLYAGP